MINHAFQNALIWAIRNKSGFQGPILEITKVDNMDIMYQVSYRVHVDKDHTEEIIRTDVIWVSDMMEYLIINLSNLFTDPVVKRIPGTASTTGTTSNSKIQNS